MITRALREQQARDFAHIPVGFLIAKRYGGAVPHFVLREDRYITADYADWLSMPRRP
jgi:hypothetical protein